MNESNLTLTELQQRALQQIRAVSFDLDDTFWDCAPVISRAESILIDWFEKHHPRVLASRTTESMSALRAELYTTHQHLVTDVTLMRKEYLRQLINSSTAQSMESAAIDADAIDTEQLVDEAFAVFYYARSEVELYEGTTELLLALKPKYKLATITNGNADLEQIGLADYFSERLGASLDNPPKPEVDMFNTCCESLDVSASELLHVGDNPHTDVLGGHNAGAWTVWFNRAKEQWPADLPRATFEVESLAELEQLLT